MLKSLSIDNFALIDKASIDFTAGFTVITGETGSGKSILLNALNLILGERANFSVIGNRKDKSVVEAEIDISGFALQGFFELHELDYFPIAIVRREIYKQGRSRAFINDVPIQLNILKDFSSRLIHIHSQYNTLELKNSNFQMEVLDILAGTLDLRHEYTLVYNRYLGHIAELKENEIFLQEASSKADYNNFQLNELIELDLDNVDYESLQSEFKKTENADQLMSALGEMIEGLSGDSGAMGRLSELKTVLEKNESYSDSFVELKNRIDSVLIELRDISDTCESELDGFENDPSKLMELASKLDKYNNAIFKHKVVSQEELIKLKDELSLSNASTSGLAKRIEELKTKIDADLIELNKYGNDLHAARLKFIPEIEDTIATSLRELKLNDTRLIFDLSKINEYSRTGISELQMLFSPNAGFEPVPINEAASGGELSRLMLALQSLIAQKIKLQTILFDEIDTGVSGDVAQKIGNTLQQMGEGMQVIAITHLPQVAAKGVQHLRVEKSVEEGITTTSVVELNSTERVEEIARLMSGDQINEAALLNAKALMA